MLAYDNNQLKYEKLSTASKYNKGHIFNNCVVQ